MVWMPGLSLAVGAVAVGSDQFIVVMEVGQSLAGAVGGWVILTL